MGKPRKDCIHLTYALLSTGTTLKGAVSLLVKLYVSQCKAPSRYLGLWGRTRRVIPLARSHTQVRSLWRADSDRPEPAISAFIRRVVSQEILSLKLFCDLMEHCFEIGSLFWDE